MLPVKSTSPPATALSMTLLPTLAVAPSVILPVNVLIPLVFWPPRVSVPLVVSWAMIGFASVRPDAVPNKRLAVAVAPVDVSPMATVPTPSGPVAIDPLALLDDAATTIVPAAMVVPFE